MLNTDPSLVTFEVDIHWALEGLNYNQDALVAFLRKYSKRIATLHVKGSDPTQNPSTIPSTDFARITDAGGPKDVTDWQRVFAAAADVDYYHWEYDLSADPFASSKVASNLLNCITFGKVRDESGGVGGTVPATLALTLGTAAGFGSFQPGVARDYTASTTATVISTAGDATLSITDPASTAPGRLVNGSVPAAPARAGRGGRRVRARREHAGVTEDVGGPDVQRVRDRRLQAVDRRCRRAPDGHVQQVLHVHAVDHDAVTR